MRSILLVILLSMTLGCASTRAGDKFDDLCIAGRIKAPAADWLNRNPHTWKQHSDYEQPIKKGDRILNRDCSDVVLAASDKDVIGLWAAVLRVFRPAR